MRSPSVEHASTHGGGPGPPAVPSISPLTHSHSCQRTFACTIFRPPPSAVLEETDRRGLGGGRGSQQRKQQSARALAATPKRAGGIGSSSRRALRTTAAAVPVDSHGMPMFSADPFEGREPPKKVVLAYSGGLDTSVILVRAPPLASCRGQTDGPAQSDRNVPAAPFGLTHAIVCADRCSQRQGGAYRARRRVVHNGVLFGALLRSTHLLPYLSSRCPWGVPSTLPSSLPAACKGNCLTVHGGGGTHRRG